MVTKTNQTYDEFAFITTGQDWDLGGSITAKQGSYIYAGGDIALVLSDAPWKVKIDGTVQSGNTHGLWLRGDAGAAKAANSTVTVGSEGTVWGTGANSAGINAQQATDIVNSGLIHGGTFGIWQEAITPSSSKSVTITNNASGTITGKAYDIDFLDTTHALIVKNAGTIGSALNDSVSIAFGHSVQVTNSGTINGPIEALSPTVGSSKITNSGYIGNSLNVAIKLGIGNDVVSNSGEIFGNLAMGGGNDVVTNDKGNAITFNVTFGNGNDKVTNAGQMGSVIMGDGINTFTNSGTVNTLTMGSGNDSATNTKILTSVALGDGNNKLTNSGTIEQIVTAGFGDDTVTNTKVISGAIGLGDGKNSFTNGGTLGSILAFGSGDDTAKNTGTIAGAINFGEGNNSFTNSGDLGAGVAFGAGNDILTNSGDILLLVAMGEGNNTLINTGILHDDVTFGAGNDVFKTTQSFSIRLEMGDGNDTFIGSTGRDYVQDGKGNDTYSLGAGDDELEYGHSGSDTFDGGTGFDEFVATFNGNDSLFINLDTKAFVFSGMTAAAGSLNTLGGSEVGKIKGFETVVGTNSTDWIHGSSAGEELRGGDGADVLIGGGGADTLSPLSDGDVDTLLYQSIKDSGPTRLTRDVIVSFEGAGVAGGDLIDLSAIDADTKTAGDQFDFIGNNEAFSKIAGELRTLTEGPDTIIQADVNGDGKADFTIAVSGIMTFDEVDFVL